MWNIVFPKFEFTVNKKKVLTTFTVVSIFGEINAELGVEI